MSSNILSYLAVVLVLCASAQARCPEGYKFIGEKCLKAVTRWLTWIDAQQYCAKDGGYLANILNQKDQIAVVDVCKKNLTYSSYVWIGALVYKDNAYFFNHAPPAHFNTSFWIYPTPNLNAYTNWLGGSPSKIKGWICLHLNEDGTWYQWECDRKLSFICEANEI